MWTDENAASAALYDRARAVMPGGSTRAAVWLDPYPPYVARGEGAYVSDVDGTEYLDLTNNLGVLIHGHAHPDVVAAVQGTGRPWQLLRPTDRIRGGSGGAHLQPGERLRADPLHQHRLRSRGSGVEDRPLLYRPAEDREA